MGDGWRQDPLEGGHTIQQRETRRGTRGDKTLGKADTASNKGKQEGVQWETKGDKTLRKVKGDKTLGKAATPSNKGKQEYNGRQMVF